MKTSSRLPTIDLHSEVRENGTRVLCLISAREEAQRPGEERGKEKKRRGERGEKKARRKRIDSRKTRTEKREACGPNLVANAPSTGRGRLRHRLRLRSRLRVDTMSAGWAVMLCLLPGAAALQEQAARRSRRRPPPHAFSRTGRPRAQSSRARTRPPRTAWSRRRSGKNTRTADGL